MRRIQHLHQTNDLHTAQEEFAELIKQLLPSDGRIEPQPGLHFLRLSKRIERVHGFFPPAFCVIAQGSKEILLGDDIFRYDPNHYLLSTMELPLMGDVIEASPEKPYLHFRLILDPLLVTSVMIESGYEQPTEDDKMKAIGVSQLDTDLLDAILRLIRLVNSPNDYKVLAPLIIREIIYRLISGEQGSRMRHLAMNSGKAHRIVRAVEKIHEKFNKPLRVEDIARDFGMSVSSFHAHFKIVTSMSPIQFQKQLRLQEARRLMLRENLEAAEASYKVGYDDASHFSREYKRHFGKPPKQDIVSLRELTSKIPS